MTGGQLAAFVAWAAASASLVAVFFWGIPLLSRIRYTTRIEVLRDKAFDMTLDGLLPISDEAVQEFIAVQEAFGRSAAHITIPRLIAYNAKFDELGVRARTRPSRNALTKEQRQTLEALESNSREALAWHLLWGSPVGMVGYSAYKSGRAGAALLRKLGQPVRRSMIPNIETPQHVAQITYVHCHQDVRAKQRAAGNGAQSNHQELVCIS